jgi:hypothetical protein
MMILLGADGVSDPPPLALEPLKPSAELSTRPDPRPALRPYITSVHSRPAPKSTAPKTLVTVEASNAGASVADLSQKGRVVAQTLPTEEPVPALPEPTVTPVPMEGVPGPVEMTPTMPGAPPMESGAFENWPIPTQVADTRIPHVDDGLAGNRQVSLSPFPNLDIQSAPLDADQLPWVHEVADERRYRLHKTLEVQSLIGFLESNGANDFEYGWYNSVIWAVPFWKEKSVGLQFAATAEPTTFPQILTEVGFAVFRRAIWHQDHNVRLTNLERVSWGFGFDGVYDSEHRIFVGQHRAQLGYAMAPHREVGTWFTVPLGSEVATVATEPDVKISLTTLGVVYYRHVWPSELDTTLFLGAGENPGGFLTGAYISYRFSPQISWVLQGMAQFADEGGQSLYTGLRFYFHPLDDYSLLSGNPQNRYRAFLAAPDHINLQFRKTIP